ncbi:MAG: hypothetical protein JWQ34_3700 [Mucilaginibacter sp.]|uniref:hypothetical protein n=1 Tax=Mucilaginibacter sp. TaxID=1882438 RepID=UPI00262F9ABB|nr:hypothetical protein [Mucilaginibacter sp.]MDB5005475.1 hypothetical protein [Mucilaginibacter sp.]
MKYLIALLITCSCFIAKAQLNSDKLVGTWELTEISYKGNAIVPQLHGYKRYKSYSPTHFTVIEVDLETNITKTSIFGTYTLSDSTYTEHILHVNRENSNMIGGNYPAIVKFDSDDAMAMVGNVNNVKIDERWKKVKANEFNIGGK